MYAHNLNTLHTKSNIKCSSCEASDEAQYMRAAWNTAKMLMDGRAEGSGHGTFGKEQKFNDSHIRGTAVWHTHYMLWTCRVDAFGGIVVFTTACKITFHVTRIECKLWFGSGKMWNRKQTRTHSMLMSLSRFRLGVSSNATQYFICRKMPLRESRSNFMRFHFRKSNEYTHTPTQYPKQCTYLRISLRVSSIRSRSPWQKQFELCACMGERGWAESGCFCCVFLLLLLLFSVWHICYNHFIFGIEVSATSDWSAVTGFFLGCCSLFGSS